MVYNNCKLYGPYRADDNRLRVILYHPFFGKHTISYAKYVMEKHLDRYMVTGECIHHIDGNPLNNTISNLTIVTRSQHMSMYHSKDKVTQQFICPTCNREFTLSDTALRYSISNRKRGKKGPFCSRSCAGKFRCEPTIRNDSSGRS